MIFAIILFVVIVYVVLHCDEQVFLFPVMFESHTPWLTSHLASQEAGELDSLLQIERGSGKAQQNCYISIVAIAATFVILRQSLHLVALLGVSSYNAKWQVWLLTMLLIAIIMLSLLCRWKFLYICLLVSSVYFFSFQDP